MSITKNNKIALPVSIDYILWSEMGVATVLGNQISIELISGAEWKNIYATPGSISFEEQTPDSPDGDLYNVALSFNTPGIDQGISAQLDNLIRNDLVLKVNFSDGTSRLIISVHYSIPSRIKTEDAKTGSRDSAKVTCSARLPHPCPFYISS